MTPELWRYLTIGILIGLAFGVAGGYGLRWLLNG